MNVKVKSEKKESIEISDLRLSQFNPRYETIEKLDGVFIADMIVKDFEESEQSSADKLYSWEGDLKNFLSLLNSLKENSFCQRGEKIILIKINDKYVVAEGNRRIWATKLIMEDLKWQDFYQTQNTDDNSNEDFQEEDEKINKIPSIKEQLKNNFSKIKKILSNKKNWDKSFEVEVVTYDFNEIKNNKNLADEILSIIYSRNLEGVQKKGKRPWGRGKFFADLLCQNSKGLSEKELRHISGITGVEQKKLKRDYGYALFVRDILKMEQQEALNNNNDNYVIDLIKKKSVSALQDNFSVLRIRTSAFDKLQVNLEEFKDKYFWFKKIEEKAEIEWKINKNNIISKEKILKFILKWWKSKVITTRPVITKHKLSFDYAVVKLLEREEINPEKIEEKKFKKTNILQWDVDELKILHHRFPKYKNVKSLLGLKETLLNFKMKKVIPADKFSVFSRLYNQLQHNFPPTTSPELLFFNAVACSIRSFYEQLLTWNFFYNEKNLELKNKIVFEKLFIRNYRQAKEHFASTWNQNKSEWFQFKDGREDQNKFVHRSMALFLKGDKEKEKYETYVNDCIHASHRYLSVLPEKDNDEILDKIKKLADQMESIVQIINKDNKFKEFINSK